MSFGLRTWGAGGTLELDTDSFTYQVMHSQLYTITSGGSITVPITGFTTDKCVAVMLPLGDVTFEIAQQAMPYIFQSNGSVRIDSRPAGSTSNGSTISFRLLAMRFRN